MTPRDGQDRKSRRKRRELVRESEWVRVYRTKPNVLEVSSRLLEDNLQPSSEGFEKKWGVLSSRERLDLCAAYQAKPALSEEDARILNVVMEMGDELAWANIVSVLTRHPDRNRVVAFIRDRLEKQSPPLANFYQAIETIGDQGSIPLLLGKYEQYLRSGVSPKSRDWVVCIDYLTCCRTLWKLTSLQEYKIALEGYLKADDKLVRDSAKRVFLQP